MKTVSFVEWLKFYAGKDYREHTIKYYVRALERAPEVLGVTLEKPIIEYTSVDEFAVLYDTLVNVEDYAEKNRNYGHGSISAALAAYKKYVLFLEKMVSKGSEKTIYSPEWR